MTQQSNKEDKITLDGKVVDSSKGIFRIELDNGHVITGRLSGKMKMHKIRVMVGDVVKVEVSTYDLNRGRIIQREKLSNTSKKP